MSISRKEYVSIVSFILVVILIGYVFNINLITGFSNDVFLMAQSAYVFVPAAVVSFIFITQRRYIWIMLISAVITAFAVQILVVGKAATLMIIAARIVAFLAIVFILNMVRAFVSRKGSICEV